MSNPPLSETGVFTELQLPSEEYSWTDKDKSGYGGFGISILKALLRYRILNRANLEKVLKIKSSDRWKKDSLSKVLRGLRVSGHITAHFINASSLTAYTLTEAGEEYLTEKGLTIPDMTTGKELIKDTKTALKWLSVNQWHIGILSQIHEKEAFYNQFVIDQKKVPSLVRYRTDMGLITLFAYPAPRTGDSINSFVEEILKAHHFVLEHPKYFPASYVIICESRTAAQNLAHQMSYIRQMRPIQDLLYIYDESTGRDRFLNALYMYDVAEEDFTKISTSLQGM